MNSPSNELFVHFCITKLTVPDDLREIPGYKNFTHGLSRRKRRQFLALFDDYTLSHSIYAEECFFQGLRVAFSLLPRLYPDE